MEALEEQVKDQDRRIMRMMLHGIETGTKITRLEQENESLKRNLLAKIQELEAVIREKSESMHTVAELEEKNERLNRNLLAKIEELMTLISQKSHLMQVKEELEQENARLSAENESLRHAFQNMEHLNNEITEERNPLQARNREMMESILNHEYNENPYLVVHHYDDPDDPNPYNMHLMH